MFVADHLRTFWRSLALATVLAPLASLGAAQLSIHPENIELSGAEPEHGLVVLVVREDTGQPGVPAGPGVGLGIGLLLALGLGLIMRAVHIRPFAH